MTRRRSVGSRLRSAGYRGFYRLPPPIRRRLVRLVAPTYTVGAVILVQDTEDRLLLLRQPPGHGWSLPGGMIDRGERPVDCAARELAEETGLRLSVDDLSAATPNAVAHSHGHWVDFVYQASVDPEDHEITVDGGEVLEARWHNLTTLPPLTVPTARLLAHFGFGPYQGYPELISR